MNSEFRVIYHPRQSRDAKPYRIDRLTGFRNRYVRADNFPTLTDALAVYPDADVSPLAATQQAHAERPHAFIERFDWSERCRQCGHKADGEPHAQFTASQAQAGAQ